MSVILKIGLFVVAFTGSQLTVSGAQPLFAATNAPAAKSIWVDGVGSGYVEEGRIIDLRFTRGLGVTYFGGNVTHDVLLGRLTFAQSINDVWAPDRWYGGNLLFTGEIMGGVQDHPDTAYLIFGTGGLRYDFAALGRIVPYVGLVVGAGATAIGSPDLSEGIQFTEQAEVGLRYFFNERVSATAGIGYMHISNAGHHRPNDGVNAYLISLGVGWAL
jgi:hypothetical protein